jgi:demethylmenaquinone methyltransferase/2-methoxy-6-polyprenyl-1,4-benzoquinol methylase
LLVHDGHESSRRFFTSTNAGSYERVAKYATFGQDFKWKRYIVEGIGNQDPVLELACGTGVLSSMLALSGREVVGLDFTFEYLRESMRRLEIPLAQGTAEILPYQDNCFGAVVSSYLAKYVEIDRLAEECWRVLRPGGIAVFHDFVCPSSPLMSRLWATYFSILRLCGNFSPAWRAVFQELDGVIRESHWEQQLQTSLRKKGFRGVSCEYYSFGTSAIVSAEKP